MEKSINANKYKELSNSRKIYKKGNVIVGSIKSIEPYGVFVKIDENTTGLLHINDISVSRINHPNDRFKIGSKVKAIVKNYDADTGKLSLSSKEVFGTWKENIKDLNEKTIVKGIVRNRDKYGVFVELKPNLVGLADYKSYVSYGDEVNVYIKKISNETKKVKLVIVD